MKAFSFRNSRYASLIPIQHISLKGIKPRLIKMSRALFLFLIPLMFFTAPQPISTMSPMAVGDYSVVLPGEDQPFDPSGYIQVPYSSLLNNMGNKITIEAWVKRKAYNRHETLVGNGILNSYWFGFSSTGKLRFCPHGFLSCDEGNKTIPSDIWTHVAVTYNGTMSVYYVNGVFDKVSLHSPGPISPGTPGQFLGIGFDPHDYFDPNYYEGMIDNLRIWSYVRSGSLIKNSMFHSLGQPVTYLLAEWPFDGDATDPARGHDGILVGQVAFSNEGAIPHDLHIPQLSVTPTLDGYCTPSEYGNATQVTVDGTQVKLMHTVSDLWVCFDDLGIDTIQALVFLDPDYTRLDPAQPEHLKLAVNNDDTRKTQKGDGAGGYTDILSSRMWNGKYKVCCGDYPSYRAEFRIKADLLNGWEHVIGLAVGKAKDSGGRILTRLWPALAVHNKPSTWSSSTLDGIVEPRTFTGYVVYQPRDSQASPVGIPGVAINLIGSDPLSNEAVAASVESNPDGSFSLTSNDDYTLHRLELGAPPKGYLAKEAQANAPGEVLDAITIDYDDAPPGSYGGIIFTLGDALPYVVDTQTGPYFQIIASQDIIDSGALDEYVDFKLRQGFAVGVASVESIEDYTGATRRDKIRAFEQAQKQFYGSRFKYVMLVGSNDVIPFAQFVTCFNGQDVNGNPDKYACDEPAANSSATVSGYKLKLSDWYYVDLVSDFDSNKNGCLLDGVVVEDCDILIDPGYTPDAPPLFRVNVAVGRIPFDTPQAVEKALQNSMHFEAQSEPFKQQTLHAVSAFLLKGQYWTPTPVGHYVPCGGVGTPNNKCGSSTDDSAWTVQQAKIDFLNEHQYISTALYEETKPEGSCPVITYPPLTRLNVWKNLEDWYFGLVHLAGHGSEEGVGRTFWIDENNNNLVESPTEPPDSKDEIQGDYLFNKDDLGSLTPDNEHGSIYVMKGCEIGSPMNPGNFGEKVLGEGHGIAWIGSLSMTSGGVDYGVLENVLKKHLRLGEAVWRLLGEMASNDLQGSVDLSTDLYGDPTLSYWGNPGGQTTLAAWPMLRFDARGQSFTPLAGPEVPKKLWGYTATPPVDYLLPPSPVVSNNGEVIVAQGNHVDVVRNGDVYQLDLYVPARGAPAIAADGTVYVLDDYGQLYAFPYQDYDAHLTPYRFERWRLTLGYYAQPPIIGADGGIAVGGRSIVYVRPDGFKLYEFDLDEWPTIGVVAVDAERTIYATREDRRIIKINFFCSPEPCITTQKFQASPGFSTPPLLAYGFVYAGTKWGEVYKMSTYDFTKLETFLGDSRITAGPVAGPDGQVLVGTENGTLYSLTQDMQLRWQRNVGEPVTSVPAFSADALYIVSGDKLRAYHPHTGDPLWQRDLGSGAGSGSVAVGYGRELYVQTVSGKIAAYGEGWSFGFLAMWAEPGQSETGQRGISLEWKPFPIPTNSADERNLGILSPQSTAIGILMQRSDDQSDWEDVAILPPDATTYFDAEVLDNTRYAYRVQMLDAEGNDSDFTQTLEEVKSLPALPHAPTLVSVTAQSADALGLVWSPQAGDVVNKYRIERRLSDTGIYTLTVQTSGGITWTVDTRLDPGTSYFYRVIAINDTGESDPSNVLSGTTRLQGLAAPQHVIATLMPNGRVHINWDPGPERATAVVEYREAGMMDFKPLGTSESNGHYSYYPGEPNAYLYRVKFVLGDNESPYTQTLVVYISKILKVFLPLVINNP